MCHGKSRVWRVKRFVVGGLGVRYRVQYLRRYSVLSEPMWANAIHFAEFDFGVKYYNRVVGIHS